MSPDVDPPAATPDLLGGMAEILEEITTVPRGEITPEQAFEADLGADSLTMIEVVVAVEMRFAVKIDEADVKSLVTIEDMVRYVQARLG